MKQKTNVRGLPMFKKEKHRRQLFMIIELAVVFLEWHQKYKQQEET